MRFLFTMGRLTIFNFVLFEIDDNPTEEPDIVVVHHHDTDDDESDGPDLFGGKSK